MTLAYRFAQQHVKQFADVAHEEPVIREHYEAMDCLNCESYLQLGIDAFNWLIRADQAIRHAVYHGQCEHDCETDEAIEALFREWLPPCDFANEWIDAQHKRGYKVENLSQFRECEQEVRTIVKSFDDHSLTDGMRQLRDEAIAEHRNGKTAEFV
jgi:hypothetical protein